MTTKVTSDAFSKLRNPYTGEPMVVQMTILPGREPLFNCPDTYSTGDSMYPTKEECLAAWDRKNGIAGLRTGQPVRCAYTGELLSVENTGFGWHFTGGFDPHLFHSRDEFLRLATMRDGKPGYVPPKSRQRVTAVPPKAKVTDLMRKTAESRRVSLDEGKIHELEGRMNGIGVRVGSGTVSMSHGGKRKRGR